MWCSANALLPSKMARWAWLAMRIRSVIGSQLPPPVSATPAAACRSLSVVVTTTDTGNPLCWPRFPEAIKARSPASNPS